MEPNIGITKKNLKEVCSILNNCLADAHILYFKLRKYHWNVQGDNFMELHKLFENHYEQVQAAIDEIAERVSQLGGMAIGTTSEFAKGSSLKETPGKNPVNNLDMIKELLADHETIIRNLRVGVEESEEKYSDQGTSDFLTGLMQKHEMMAWTLRRYL
ncbi:DNA starvation/stationary phase protection protein [Flavobacterium sp. xlx-214]|uniref:Dps family protein n=1 Tax=unclassified Flavobacterium TaxID=196869 RepID=UPI0013D8D2BF|nr:MULTISPECIES: DNA starvation/stationary phase protection protein [unclassified Flavobacterium]MBA5793451.1 DNA starvation/stationary phase protection protein [Flavobacterium sp. xlx-221]QMI82777.1 DNA starvation/stationary phase protection protein [Flavobacterium sp. xlx-214]